MFRSKSLQAVHLSDNEIPEKILMSLMFVFGIPNANEGDLFDSSNQCQIERYQTNINSDNEQGNLRIFIPLSDEGSITTKDQALAKITNSEIIKQLADQKTYL